MQGKVALGGGGGATDSRLLDATFAGWLGTHGRLLYWPIAMRGMIPFAECYAWLTATFAPLQVTDITMWTELDGHQRHELDRFDGIYIGGGNTYGLLAECLASGFDRHLVAYVVQGGAVYGGSAGAVLLGKNIQTVAHMDRNLEGLQATACLNLARDHAVWVHYTAQDDARIAELVAQFGEPVLALAEPAGATVVVDELTSVGLTPGVVFDQQGKRTLSINL
ncbi:MAG: Type 1 glutamine amidotransferase-like domain-containing protein [Caldilineaceae bacterium]|nr:Type 1 glutamine amidotransferase-like domain-containing protein [Caldilineaceae bacterium]